MNRTLIAGILTAITSTTVAQTTPTPRPAQQTPAPGAQPAPYTGSLLRDSQRSLTPPPPGAPAPGPMASYSLFAVPEPVPKTFKRHDLITVVVRDESAFTAQGTTDLKKQADMDAQLQEFIKLSIANFAIQGGAQGATPPEIKAALDHNFKGEASVDRSDSFTTRVTAEIVDVKPNGTLIVQARSTTKVDEEEQILVLSGVCRTEDIQPDNTILSTQLYDQSLSKSHKGAVRDTTNRGWMTRILDFVNPF